VFVVVDASQIEARGVDWISDESTWLGAWRQGRPIYREFASQLYGVPVEEIGTHSKERGAGKTGILGCGYGMGAAKAQAYGENVYKIDLTLTEAQRIVNLYRDTHPSVCRFWREIEQVFKSVCKYKTAPRKLAADRLEVGWVPDQDVMYIELPSTRRLYYHRPRLRSSAGNTHIATEDHPKMWGGVLTENIVQAIARDVLGENILALEAEGLHVCLHVHDEVVICVPENEAKDVLQHTVEVFHRVPTWATDWPLAGEGKIMRRYGK
jgi:DNA polymerase